MKKIYLFILTAICTFSINAASYTVSIVGTSYSPNVLNVLVGDVVTIQASTSHPLSEVDQTTWNANGTTTLSSGFGTKTANHTFTITGTNNIYYVCNFHVGLGMKGQINVSGVGISEQNLHVSNMNLFPNPASTKLNLSFNLSLANQVEVSIFDITGRKISVLHSEKLLSGNNKLSLEIPSSLEAGNYFVELNTINQSVTRKLIITK